MFQFLIGTVLPVMTQENHDHFKNFSIPYRYGITELSKEYGIKVVAFQFLIGTVLPSKEKKVIK